MPRIYITFTAIILVLSMLVAYWWFGNRDDTGINITSVSSQPAFVTASQCNTCHRRETVNHQGNGHADTFRASTQCTISRQLAGRTFEDPERGYSYHYHHDADAGLSVSIPELNEERFSLQYAIGSGQHAVTFVTLVREQHGDSIGVEHRVSMYRDKEDNWQLDLTPGHRGAAAAQKLEQFGRVLRGDKLADCIACHTTTAELSGDTLVDLRPNVGCQSCHGPGSVHIAAMESGEGGEKADFLKHSVMQEIELCGRCHRLPASTSIAAAPGSIQNVRFQPASLLRSRCFEVSKDLSCSTCHDPHQHVSQNLDHYVDRCRSCHEGPDSVHCPVSPKDNCIECHMPATDVHRGIEFHDHWIRVRHDIGSQ